MYRHDYWIKRVPGFVRGIDPLFHTTYERLAARIISELRLYQDADPECDIKTPGQAALAIKFLRDIAIAKGVRNG